MVDRGHDVLESARSLLRQFAVIDQIPEKAGQVQTPNGQAPREKFWPGPRLHQAISSDKRLVLINRGYRCVLLLLNP